MVGAGGPSAARAFAQPGGTRTIGVLRHVPVRGLA
jgi:hypothetical protein